MMTSLNKRHYEISIEGNLNFGKFIPSTLQAYAPGELKPPDSEMPVPGFYEEFQGELATVRLGVGPDGIPLAGRCIAIKPNQRIKLVNRSKGPLLIKFAHYFIGLSTSMEILLDKPVGEYLAPGVHFMAMGPELWVQPAEAAVRPPGPDLGLPRTRTA